MKLFLPAYALLGYFALSAGWAGEAKTVSVAFKLKDLPKDQEYSLRVLYVEDARLPMLARAARIELYRRLEQRLLAAFGYRARVHEVGHRQIGEFFAANEATFARYAKVIRGIDIDVSSGPGMEKLRQTITRAIARLPLATVQRHLGSLPAASPQEAEESAFRQFEAKLNELRNIQLIDGSRFFEPSELRQSSFIYWAVLLKELKEADLVITNSMIAGGDIDMPLYVIARGGLTTGFTNNNSHNPQQAAVMVGLFPFLSNAPVFLNERGRIPPDELLDVISTFTLHEFGHYFLRFAEHYDHPNCVHVAPVGLRYYEWYQTVRFRGTCPLKHQKLQHY